MCDIFHIDSVHTHNFSSCHQSFFFLIPHKQPGPNFCLVPLQRLPYWTFSQLSFQSRRICNHPDDHNFLLISQTPAPAPD